MLAAVEIYNKTAFTYREETFCLLMTNAWEILLKARIVQKHGNDLNSIRLKRDARSYQRDDVTGDARTINLERALAEADAPNEVRQNVSGLYHLRNEVQHLGLVEPPFSVKVLHFGTAAVRNMVKALNDWFGESTDDVYPFPMGFVGAATTVSATSQRQRQLLQRLDQIASVPADTSGGYHIVAEIEINIHASGVGGGTIGITNDPKAAKVQLADDRRLDLFPDTYTEGLIPALRERYTDFKTDRKFYDRMKKVKADKRCTYVRPLDPAKPGGTKKEFYNVEEVCRRHLDQHCTRL